MVYPMACSSLIGVYDQTQYSGSFLYPACITFVKLSILLQYRRLFFAHSKAFHFQINALIVLVSLWGAGIIFTAFGMCSPMAKLWNPTLDGSCIPLIPFYYGLQIPNIVTDLLIIVLPIREILILELSPKLKIGASAMFLLGMITLIFDIVRLVAMIRLEHSGPDMTCELLHPSAIVEQNTDDLLNRQSSRRCGLDYDRTHRRHRRRLHPQHSLSLSRATQVLGIHVQ